MIYFKFTDSELPLNLPLNDNFRIENNDTIIPVFFGLYPEKIGEIIKITRKNGKLIVHGDVWLENDQETLVGQILKNKSKIDLKYDSYIAYEGNTINSIKIHKVHLTFANKVNSKIEIGEVTKK